MASYEDFDSDTDDEFLKDVVAVSLPGNQELPLSIEKNMCLSIDSVGLDKPDEKTEVIHGQNHIGAVKNFRDVSFSSDNFLTDPCRGHQCSMIQEAWISGGMGGQQVKQLTHKLFSSSQNPHLSAVYLMYHSYDFFKNKTNSLAAFVVDQFEVWLEEFLKANGYYPAVDQQTTREAMVAVSRQRNGKILKKIVTLYHGVHYKAHLIEVVNELIGYQEFASACRLAVALELFSQFEKEDFVLPLIVQDKLPLAEEYLRKNRSMQQDVVSFLDKHIKQPCEMLRLISERKSIPDVNYEKMNSKNVANMVTRLAKRFELDEETHPETILRQKVGSLRYLIHKKYNERSIDNENWEELVEVAVANSLDLQVELIQQLHCIDEEAASKYAEIYAIPEERLPYNFSPYVKSDSSSQAETETNEIACDIQDKFNTEFYSLTMPFENIHWICSWEGVHEFLGIVSKSTVVGVDIEWPPFGTLAKATVLQIATHDKIFLLDIFSLLEDKSCSVINSQQLIGDLFGNRHILKLGYGLKEDLHVLSRSLPGIGDVSKSIVNWIDIKNLWSNIETKYPSFLPPAVLNDEGDTCSQETHKGLSGLVKLLLGLPLDKKEQFSDWQKRPLRTSQLIYAALDAFCLLEVYDYLQKRSQFLEIDWRSVLEKLGTVHHSFELKQTHNV
ncbi:exonuclease mut-7 homolog [Daphnia pulex]|uniref:exonuclease mut-7 homolog n=1 Tax=Daphnia pulex TaxID=6669 RepID=UPI001EE00EA0|nr:exonuclease mut-7 homolog [Daphnia pulex]